MDFSAPPPFDSIESVGDAIKFLKELDRKCVKSVTRYESACERFPISFSRYLVKCMRAPTKAEKNKVCADMIRDTLQDCSPQSVQLFYLSQNFVTKCHSFFNNDPYANNIANHYYKKYLPINTKCDSKEELNMYCNAVASFRTFLTNNNFDTPEAKTIRGNVSATVSVGDNCSDLIEMLQRMSVKRALKRGSISREITSHAKEVLIAISGDLNELIILPWKNGISTKRASPGGALRWDADEKKFVNDPTDKMLLLSTGIANLIQSGHDLSHVENFLKLNYDDKTADAKTNTDFLIRAFAEAKSLISGNTTTTCESGFEGQWSSIDPVWFTFFIAFCICKLSVKYFYAWQRIIYAATTTIRSKNGIRLVLDFFKTKFPGINALLESCSESTHIHSPPWMFNFSRIYDIAAVIGACDCGNVTSTISHPSISWRYFLMLDYSVNKSCMDFLTLLDKMEGMGLEQMCIEEEGIRLSEKVLHQILMSVDAPLACTNFLNNPSTNAYNVTIVE